MNFQAATLFYSLHVMTTLRVCYFKQDNIFPINVPKMVQHWAVIVAHKALVFFLLLHTSYKTLLYSTLTFPKDLICRGDQGRSDRLIISLIESNYLLKHGIYGYQIVHRATYLLRWRHFLSFLFTWVGLCFASTTWEVLTIHERLMASK